MPKFTTDSKFLTHADLPEDEDTVYTIKGYEQETVGQGPQASEKWVIYFRETKKGLALNKTNGNLIIKALGSDEMDDWIGKKIALYVKDDVEFQGEIVSAIRIRPKSPAPAPKASAQPATHEEATWPCEGEYHGDPLSVIPTAWFEHWLQQFPQAASNLRKMVKMELARRDE